MSIVNPLSKLFGFEAVLCDVILFNVFWLEAVLSDALV